jgi:hypothetical protein
MSDKILTAIKGKKEAFHLWKTNGRLKNSDNTYTINKKNTTIELRKQCRLEILVIRHSFTNSLNNKEENCHVS